MIREAWKRVRLIKDAVGAPDRPADRRSIGEIYDEGEAWVRIVLDEAGVSGEAEVDALTAIVNENGQTTLHNALSIDPAELRQAAIVAGIAKPGDPPEPVERMMVALVMHSSGFANGLALGLLLKRDA